MVRMKLNLSGGQEFYLDLVMCGQQSGGGGGCMNRIDRTLFQSATR
jgi:hypothetical protein